MAYNNDNITLAHTSNSTQMRHFGWLCAFMLALMGIANAITMFNIDTDDLLARIRYMETDCVQRIPLSSRPSDGDERSRARGSIRMLRENVEHMAELLTYISRLYSNEREHRRDPHGNPYFTSGPAAHFNYAVTRSQEEMCRQHIVPQSWWVNMRDQRCAIKKNELYYSRNIPGAADCP